MADETSPDSGAQEKPELALDLNFVPTWARRPPDNPYAGREERPPRDDDRGGRRDDRRGPFGRRRNGERRGPRPPDGFRSRDGFPRTGAGPRPAGGFHRDADRRGAPRANGERRPFREPLPRLDVRVSFLPDRERLALVVRDIQASRRAFPLIEIANRFLGREDLYLVKLEMPPAAEGAARQTLVQCLHCRRVFRLRANAEAHVLNDHLDLFFAIEETETEPPAGHFACVARCRLSGTLLGPPNHHGYNEKIQELWSTRFAHMSKADYLGHVETVRDEALVEQWKESVRKQTVYRLKEPPEGQAAAALAKPEAQEWLRAGRLNGLLRESGRCLVPGPQSKRFDDGALRAAVGQAWQRETRFPFTLAMALRPAFRHMRLHLFKVNGRETYVTAVPPAPVDLTTALPVVREIVAFLEAHPGITRQQVLAGLRPGENPESPAASELLLHLGSLIANGGVIEFFNATLALPHGGARATPAGVDEAAAPTATAEGPPAAEATADSGKMAEEPDTEPALDPASAMAPEPVAPVPGAPTEPPGGAPAAE